MGSGRKFPESKGKLSVTCHIDSNKSMGLDGIHPRMLKDLAYAH